ncbi:MAG: phenylalanine--tRNA ligase subunit beta [Polyangiaceae bacterium]|nr:phenylalanine--tRNA ligase subunit beta [Polyangiaceae bacterium]
MKASHAWISALVPGLDASPRELAERYTRAGLEVEGIEELGAGTRDVVIAEVRKVEPHPARAKLRLVTVDRGGAEQRIVCGAPNVPDPGGLVALAPLGTTLPAVGMTLTAREIGGIVSEGMLCSEVELGLVASVKKDADPGILVLEPRSAKPGTPLREAVPGVHDWILDISLTPNRPDCLGHVGLAREAAALFGKALGAHGPDAPARVVTDTAIGKHVSVTNEDPERCPMYGAAMVVDVTIGPSPGWLRYRLESLGIRSISNVVDVTNLILLEFGHPMHAFDLDLVRGASIVVRRARPGEVLATLDGVERRLDPDALVIADAEGAVALAGVMGGAGSEIRATTRRVLLECAYFTPRGVRRASRRHGVHTESSHRFERGVDPDDIPDVLAQAASLMTALGRGAAVPGSILAGPGVPARPPIRLRARRMSALLGVEVPLAEATATLERLGCEVAARTEEAVDLAPPSHRPDLHLEADLIEEVVRVRGLDSVPAALPAIRPQAPRATGLSEARARRAAIEVGLSEAITYAFVSPKEIAALGLPPAGVTLLNPLGEDRSVMRTTLLPGLLEALRRARRHGVPDVRLFTVGARILAGPAGLPDEVSSLAAVIAGSRRAGLAAPVPVDVYDAKGVAVEIVERVTRREARVDHQPEGQRAPYLHPRGAGRVSIEGAPVGGFGPLHPDVIDALDLDGPAFVVELDLAALARVGVRTPQLRGIPSLPAATRDIALVVHDDVSAGAVADAIRDAAGDLCESVELFDLFRGGSVPADHRSLAFHVVYRDPRATTDPENARTLTDEEVDRRHQAVVEATGKKLGAVLRG